MPLCPKTHQFRAFLNRISRPGHNFNLTNTRRVWTSWRNVTFFDYIYELWKLSILFSFTWTLFSTRITNMKTPPNTNLTNFQELGRKLKLWFQNSKKQSQIRLLPGKVVSDGNSENIPEPQQTSFLTWACTENIYFLKENTYNELRQINHL